MLLLFLFFLHASGIGCSDLQLYLLWTVFYVCGLLGNDLFLQGNAWRVWAGLVQLEKLDNEAKVEGFGLCELPRFAVILSCSDILISISYLTCVGFWKLWGAWRE